MKKYFILAAAAAMFAACSNTDEITQTETPNERIPLLIGGAYQVGDPNVTMRSTNQAVQNDTISEIVKLGLFVLKDNETTVSSPQLDYEFFNIAAETFNPNTTNKTTDLRAQNNTTDVLVFPSDKAQGINLYAYAPYNNSPGITDIDASTTTSNVVPVSVQTDQSTDEGYILSDVLWGCVGKNSKGISTYSGLTPAFTGHADAVINGTQYSAAKTAATDGFVQGNSPRVIIPMLHRAAKVVVKLKVSGMPVDKLLGAQVIVKAPTDANLRIDNGALTASNSATDITMTDKLGYKKDYNKSPGDTDYETELTASDSESDGVLVESSKIVGYSCSAIVMPEDLTASSQLFEIQLRDAAGKALGTKYKYFLPTAPNPTSFESGKEYTYTITVTASGLQVTATVHNWDSVTGENGEATLE